MRVVCINGSHKREAGCTEVVARPLCEGLAGAGAIVEKIYPAGLNITPCNGCYTCIVETPGRCGYRDDMADILEKIDTADLLVFATPVYCDAMTSSMKKMVERLMPLYGTEFEFRNGRTVHHRAVKREQRAVLLCTSGDPEMESFNGTVPTIRRIFGQMEVDIVAQFLFPASHIIMTRPDLVERQLAALGAAGEELAAGGVVSDATCAQVNASYVEDPRMVAEQITAVLQRKRMRARRRSAASSGFSGDQ